MLSSVSSVSFGKSGILKQQRSRCQLENKIANIKQEMNLYAKAITQESDKETRGIFGYMLNTLYLKLKEFESEYAKICNDTFDGVNEYYKQCLRRFYEQ